MKFYFRICRHKPKTEDLCETSLGINERKKKSRTFLHHRVALFIHRNSKRTQKTEAKTFYLIVWDQIHGNVYKQCFALAFLMQKITTFYTQIIDYLIEK